MGGSRKGKGNHSQSGRKNASSSVQSAHLSKQQLQQLQVDLQVNQFSEVWEEAEATNKLFSSWKEISIAALFLIALALLSVVIGIVAGIYFSHNYIDDSLNLFDHSHKVTTFDNDLAGRIIMSVSSSLQSGRVVKSVKDDGRYIISLVPGGDQIGIETGSNNGEPFRDIFFSEPSIKPTLCSDGQTVGFNDWPTLKSAVREANSLSAEKFLRWSEYFSSIEEYDFGAFEDDALYYEDESIFTICPGARLKARKGPIFINSENVFIKCEDCTIDVGGTHFSFGPHARNVMLRGITFMGQQTSSMTFYYDGADVTFEDCAWILNQGSHKHKPVADVNSTSHLSFHRCEIVAPRASARGRHRSFGNSNAFMFAISLR